MNEIQEFSVPRLRIEQDFGFQKKVEAATELLTLESDQAAIATFKAALAEFEEALLQSKNNSPLVKELDDKADATWRGLRNQARAVVDHPNEARSVIATKASDIIDKYGDIAKLAYSEEYGSMHNLLTELDALGIDNQQQIFIDEWVTELHVRYNEFMAALSEQTNQQAAYIVGATKQSRSKADEAYRAFIKRINALAYVNEPANYTAFIAKVNVLIDLEQKNIASRKTRSANSKKEE